MSIQERIKIFEEVRDIPFTVALDLGEKDTCCSMKSELLSEKLTALGLKCRQRLCDFEWEKEPLSEKVMAVYNPAKQVHQYVEVFVPESNEWVSVDATWDKNLERAGFNISEWDGLTNTSIAVTPLKVLSCEEGEKLIKWFNEDIEYAKNWFAQNKVFHAELNNWLEEVRK